MPIYFVEASHGVTLDFGQPDLCTHRDTLQATSLDYCLQIAGGTFAVIGYLTAMTKAI